MTALAGAVIACVVDASRITFAQGRHGTLSALFGETRSTNQVPINALHLIWAATMAAATVVVSLWLKNPNSVFDWWAGSIAFFALSTYFFVRVSSFLHHRRNRKFNWLLHGVVPIGGLMLIIYAIQSFFQALLGLSWASGKNVLVFGLAYCLLVYVLVPTEKLKAAFAGPKPEVSEFPHSSS